MNCLVRNFVCLSLGFFLCSCSEYDCEHADAVPNRRAFRQLFRMDPAEQKATGIYFFADEWGGDAAYWFAFSAPPEAIDKIIAHFELNPTVGSDRGFTPPGKEVFSWWNAEEREKSRYYEFRDDRKELLYCLWYNPGTRKCQVNLTRWEMDRIIGAQIQFFENRAAFNVCMGSV